LSHHAWAKSMERFDGIIERLMASGRRSNEARVKVTAE